MPDNNFIELYPAGAAADNNSDTRIVNLPLRVSCGTGVNLTPGNSIFVGSTAELWNCRKTDGEFPYCIPVKDGENFDIQFHFTDKVNNNAKNPVHGWREPTGNSSTYYQIEAKLYSCNDVLISNDPADFCESWGCGWISQTARSYQQLRLDIALIKAELVGAGQPTSGFYFEFTTYFITNFTMSADVTFYSENFCVDPCFDTIQIQGEYDGRDCSEGWYGEFNRERYVGGGAEVPFQYINTRRVHAEVLDTGGSLEVTEYNKSRVRTEVDLEYTFSLSRPVPDFIKNWILRYVLAAERVILDGGEFRIDNASISNKLQNSRMFLFEVTVYQECDTEFKCD